MSRRVRREHAQTTGAPQLERLILSAKTVISRNSSVRADNKVASAATRRSTEQTLVTAVTRIWNLGYHISEVRELRTAHCEALVQNWLDNGYSVSTVVNNLCRLRALGRWIGNPDLVPKHASRTWLGLSAGQLIGVERRAKSKRETGPVTSSQSNQR